MKFVCALLLVLTAACSNGPSPSPAPACDEKCQDANAVRGLRETLKLAFNLTLQGKPVGSHDVTVPCIEGGRVRVFGTATSNADQGATMVKLTYELVDCSYTHKDDKPEENYALSFSGTVTQEGTIAVQPSATTALIMKSDSLAASGSVYDPPLSYEKRDCPLDIAQDGSRVFGKLCGREAAFDF